MLSIIIESHVKYKSRKVYLREDLEQLRQYATEKYKANPEIENKFNEYFQSEMTMSEMLVQLFGEP